MWLERRESVGMSNAVLGAAVGLAHSTLPKADMSNTARTPGSKDIKAFLKIICWNNHRIADLKCLLGN